MATPTRRALLSTVATRKHQSLSSPLPSPSTLALVPGGRPETDHWRACNAPFDMAASVSQHRRRSPNNSFVTMTQPFHCGRRAIPFASTRQKHSTSKQNNKKGRRDVYKQHLSSSDSILGKRPGQTSFSPPKQKTSSGPRVNPKAAESTPKKEEIQRKWPHVPMPLVVPSAVPNTAQPSQSPSNHDNKDHAHIQPSVSPYTQEMTDKEDNPLRSAFLQQGIIPPPPRPKIEKSAETVHRNDFDSPNSLPPIIPDADPSGVSNANPEDILDMASMYDPSIHLPDKPDFNSPANRIRYEAGTPMTDELIAYIGVRGPITVAEYMRRVLRDTNLGYYTGKGSREGRGKMNSAASGVASVLSDDDVDDDDDWDLDDDVDGNNVPADGDSTTRQPQAGGEHVIGPGGDFITAPEISQLFGESLLVWLMTQYQTLNSPSRIQIVEIGPGKGTLICDIIRSAITTFPDFASSLTAVDEKNEGCAKNKVAVGVHLVEVTKGMRARQRESLQNLEQENSIIEKGFSFRFTDVDNESKGKERGGKPLACASDDVLPGIEASKRNTICFSWHDLLSSVPTHNASTGESVPTFIICQELVDALPVHSFQKIEGGAWRERLVDVAVRDESEASEAAGEIRAAATRKYACTDASHARSKSSSSSTFLSESGRRTPRLRFVLPPDTTPALRTILRVDGRGLPTKDNPRAQALDSLPVGSVIEACPEGILLAQDIADRIEKCGGGAALIIDYGGDGSSGGDTLRGFWKHTQTHPLSRPGEVDVTADVDFGALRESVNRRIRIEESLKRKRDGSGSSSPSSHEVNVAETVSKETGEDKNTPKAFGPISQGRFLAQMGVIQRVESKIANDSTTDDEAEELYSAMERLIGEDQMGERYKVLSIARKKDRLFPPPGF